MLSEPDEVTQQLIHEELEVGSQSAGVYGNHIGTFRKNFLFSSEAKTCWDALFSDVFILKLTWKQVEHLKSTTLTSVDSNIHEDSLKICQHIS